jgi:twitching motility protein PilT
VTVQLPTHLDALLEQMWEVNASDLLLSVGAPPFIRVDGDMQPVRDEPVLDEEAVLALLPVLRTATGDVRVLDKEHDFAFSWRDQARVRGNAFLQRGTRALSLRVVPTAIPSFEELGLPDAVRRWVNLPQGLILMTGPTGAGKSTSLASMIDWIAERRPVHILTIEDPIEYVYEQKVAAVNQREVGSDTDSFADALRAVLREDPDVLLVGEMRDPESIAATLTIAETGHLVFATLHSNDTAQALDRVVDVFPAHQQGQIRLQLANTLAGIMHQRILPKIGGGRVAAFEVLMGTHAARNLIRQGKTAQIRNVVATGQQDLMQTLEASLSQLVVDGVISYEEAVAHSLYPNEITNPAALLDVTANGGRKRR